MADRDIRKKDDRPGGEGGKPLGRKEEVHKDRDQRGGEELSDENLAQVSGGTAQPAEGLDDVVSSPTIIKK